MSHGEVKEEPGFLSVTEKCPNCGNTKRFYLANYRHLEGEIYCSDCNTFVRIFDAS